MRTFVLFCLVAAVYAQNDVDDIAQSIFNTIEGIYLNPNESPSPSEPCGVNSVCVPFHLCKDNVMNTNGGTIIDIRAGADIRGVCSSYLEKCCGLNNVSTNQPIPVEPTPESCGYRNIDGVRFRITGDKDNESQFGEFPWMVAVMKQRKANEDFENIYHCGGSLIHPKVVLTAAHYLYTESANNLKIRAGEWDSRTKKEIYLHQDRNVAEIATHGHFDDIDLHYDIALLLLTAPFKLAPHINTICLPPADTTFDFSQCVATGWGKDKFGDQGRYQAILKKIDLPIVPRHQCQKSLRSTRLGETFQLGSTFICAGGEPGKDMCIGDGGSPLVCPIQGSRHQYQQAGIVAWGIGCGDAIPGVYASVAALRPWLDKRLALWNIESSYYTA